MAIQVGADLPGEGARRQGHPAGRRARRAARPRRHHRRRRGGHHAPPRSRWAWAPRSPSSTSTSSRLAYLDDVFLGRVTTLASDSENIARAVREADLVVGGVLIPGGKAPKLVSEELIKEMSQGSVVVDVAVDQGGCIETCKPTTHDNPTYVVHGVVHYCVANMPGAVPQTSTFALTNTTRPYARKIADLGLVEAVQAGQGARPRPQHLRRPRHLRGRRQGPRLRPTCPCMDALGGEEASRSGCQAPGRLR